MHEKYDIIVIGAGHAGCEAAAAAANMGSKTLLITMNMNTIAQMSCNPAMGGIAKGQIIREIDALGGYSAIVTDKTAIQFRMLNKSKGPAMWSPRAQSDRMRFAEEWRLTLEGINNLDFWQEMVVELMIKNRKLIGIKTSLGLKINSKAVILTNGTFLNGLIHIGQKNFSGGRSSEQASKGITEQLIQLGFESGRMKTGTPPRIDGRSLDYSKMEEQKGDERPNKFSYLAETEPLNHQKSCFISYTNQKVHEILQTGFKESPMFEGRIQGLGPRYCPSIEDKISRFADRTRHQIFIEPEGWNTIEIYLNGFSTSLPENIQFAALKEIPGFKNAKMFRPGYAIEYDFFPPTQLNSTLETKYIENLYFAGQINGTTGYEEAACQGLMAGINAHQKLNNYEPFVLKRDEAYIGVLIDDLINKGTNEPYRMFTSRAEFRLLLRQDNADLRLTEKGYRLGLSEEKRYNHMLSKKKATSQLINELKSIHFKPQEASLFLKKLSSAPIKDKSSLYTILKRPEIQLSDFKIFSSSIKHTLNKYSLEAIEQAEIQVKYETYIEREKQNSEKMQNLESLKIKKHFNYQQINSLSAEAKEKLSFVKPETLGQASRVSGVSPSDVSVLMVYLNK
ncbi:MAG: tRNA uridine-5-carboxymethylaminomethyl(34) synthesis enzyme MnmG [Bacteroidota bacterium]